MNIHAPTAAAASTTGCQRVLVLLQGPSQALPKASSKGQGARSVPSTLVTDQTDTFPLPQHIHPTISFQHCGHMDVACW
jgi:hypothetical protein